MTLPAHGMSCLSCGHPATRWTPGEHVIHDDGRECPLGSLDDAKGPTMRSDALRLAVLRALRHRLKDADTEATSVFLDALDEGDTKAAALPDGTRLGKVTKVAGRRTPRVDDEHTFVEWVKRTHPEEIEETVRPAFRDKILRSAKEHGQAVDETSGELVPGVSVQTGNPYIAYRGESGSDDVIATRWRELLPTALHLDTGEQA